MTSNPGRTFGGSSSSKGMGKIMMQHSAVQQTLLTFFTFVSFQIQLAKAGALGAEFNGGFHN